VTTVQCVIISVLHMHISICITTMFCILTLMSLYDDRKKTYEELLKNNTELFRVLLLYLPSLAIDIENFS